MIRRLSALLLLFACACGAPETNKEGEKVGSTDTELPSDGSNPVVLIKTSMGDIKAELFAEKSPITVKNFLSYVDEKHYDGCVFHRVIGDFMIQGGGFKKGFSRSRNTESLQLPRSKQPIRNEAKNGVSNTRGTLAMARTNHPHSATDQFFINTVDNTEKLDAGKFSPDGYAVFGKVIAGMGVVDAIKQVRTKAHDGHKDVPIDDVIIESIRREEAK